MDIITTIVLLTNTYRTTPLKVDPLLSRVAQQRAENICKDFSHDMWWVQVVEPVRRAQKRYVDVAENLAKDFNDPYSVVYAWANSPTHMENMKNPAFKKIGVARAKSCNTYVQVFSN